jgi:hypothetical protein
MRIKVLKCSASNYPYYTPMIGEIFEVQDRDLANYFPIFNYGLKATVGNGYNILKRDCEVLPDEFKVKIIKSRGYWYGDSVGEIFTVRYSNSHTGVFITTVDGIGECGIDYEDCEILPEEYEKRVHIKDLISG